MWQYRSDHYRLQRLALLPTADVLPISELRSALQGLSEVEQRQLLALIVNQGLQFFWLEALRALPELSFSPAWRKQLKEPCFKCTTRYLAQKKALIELDRLFAEEQIPYAVFKGAHVREVVYPNPAYRPSVDIDLLVSPDEKIKAVQALCANSYTLFPDPANVSHEVSLAKDNVHLDLHWHIMRPGRTRIELTDLLLQSRQRCGFFWGLDNDMTLLVMLVHPVFTKYSTAPQSSIVRLIDLKRWVETQKIDWQRLLHLLEDTGLKTAAWITATILADLTGCRLPAFVHDAISPPHAKRLLLKQWLDLNLSSKFANYPIFPKYIFTLLAHDGLSDIARFLRAFQQGKQRAETILKDLQKASCTGQNKS